MATDISFTTKTVKSSGEIALVDRNDNIPGIDIVDLSDPRRYKDGTTHRKTSGQVKLSDFYKTGSAKLRDWLPNFYYAFESSPNYDIPASGEIKFSDFYGAKNDVYTGIGTWSQDRGSTSTGGSWGGTEVAGWYSATYSDWNTGDAWWGNLGTTSSNDSGNLFVTTQYVGATTHGSDFVSMAGMGSSSWRVVGLISRKHSPSGSSPNYDTLETNFYVRFASSVSSATNSGWTRLRGHSQAREDLSDDDLFSFLRTGMAFTKGNKTVRWQISATIADNAWNYNSVLDSNAPLIPNTESPIICSLE